MILSAFAAVLAVLALGLLVLLWAGEVRPFRAILLIAALLALMGLVNAWNTAELHGLVGRLP